MIENVSQIFAKANQVKTSEKILYCKRNQTEQKGHASVFTYKSLNVEEEHSDDTMARLVEPEEVDQCINGCSERSVQPATTLTDQFRSRF